MRKISKRLIAAASGAAMLATLVSMPAMASADQTTCTKGTSTIAQCFPDTNMAAAVAKAFKKNVNSVLSASDFNTTSMLMVDKAGIKSIDGVQNFTNLDYLDIYDNSVTDLTPVAGLTKLHSIEMAQNSISDLKPLAGLTNLDDITMDNNPVSDLTPLTGLNKLYTLMISNTKVSDLSPLANLTAMKYLYVGYTSVSSFAPLANMKKLESLDASSTKTNASNVDQLVGLPSLKTLDMDSDGITDVTAFKKLTGLQTLGLTGNMISDLSPLAGKQYTELYASSQDIKLPKTNASTFTIRLPIGLDGKPVPVAKGSDAKLEIYPDYGKYDESKGTVTWSNMTSNGSASVTFKQATTEYGSFGGTITQEYDTNKPYDPSQDLASYNKDKKGQPAVQSAAAPSATNGPSAKQQGGNQAAPAAPAAPAPAGQPAAAPAAAAPVAVASKSAPAANNKQLATTGSSVADVALAVVVLAASGAGLMLSRRRA